VKKRGICESLESLCHYSFQLDESSPTLVTPTVSEVTRSWNAIGLCQGQSPPWIAQVNGSPIYIGIGPV